MTRRVLAVALLVGAVALAAAARLLAGDGVGAAGPGATGSATRLGPRDGETVSGYVERTRSALDARRDREPTYALVAADRYLTPAQVPAAVPGAPLVRALVRVPLPRVQTRLFEVPAHTSADIAGGMTAAASGLEAEVRSGRTVDPVAAAVARAQAERLRQGCACVLGAVVRATPDVLSRLARTRPVRAVEAAPAGEPLARLAFAPLLPEQRHRVGPPPDDGAAALVSAVPPAGGTTRTPDPADLSDSTDLSDPADLSDSFDLSDPATGTRRAEDTP